MKFPRYGIITEDIAAIGGVALPTVYGHIHHKSFPKPLGKFFNRFVWDAREVRHFYRTRIDGRTVRTKRRRRA
jgi:predicted DNA-binding transcriptional regulator AlpA